ARPGKFGAQRRDGRRRENQIADPFELKKQNFHAKTAPIKVAQASCLWPPGAASAGGLRHFAHRDFVSIEQARAEMAPSEIFNDAAPRPVAHPLNDFRMSLEMLERRRDGIDISWPDDDSFNPIAHDIARFPGRDLRQAAGGG